MRSATSGAVSGAKRRDWVEAMAVAGEARICNECLDLCDEIVSEERP